MSDRKQKIASDVMRLAEELWRIGYAEKCRLNKVRPTVKFNTPDFDHAQKMGWIKIAKHILKTR